MFSFSPVLAFFAAMTLLCAAAGRPNVCTAQSATSEVAATKASPSTTTPAGTARQRAWLNASPEQRVRLAEKLGEEGARDFAKSKGWKPIMDGTGKTLAQGPDQVYRDINGRIHVLEAKGGSGQLRLAYGYPQGSSEWAVESAKRVARSTQATAAQKAAANPDLFIEFQLPSG